MTIDTKIKLQGDRILLKHVSQEGDNNKAVIRDAFMGGRKEYMRVIAIGTDASIPVKVGDHVYIDTYGNRELIFGGETYIYIRSEDVLAILCD